MSVNKITNGDRRRLSLRDRPRTAMGLRAAAFASVLGFSWGCGSTLAPEIDTPVFLVGGASPKATLTCNAEFEAVPALVPGNSATPLFAAMGFDRMSVAEGGWDGWSQGPGLAPGFTVPVHPADPLGLERLTGDSYTTFSTSKNLAFVYFIGRPSTSQNSCVAVAATSPKKLPLNEWDFPAVCLSESRGDQCAVLQVDATNTFYAACAYDGNIRIQAFDDCEGAPGPAYGCSRTAIADLPNGSRHLQFSLAANPCSGHLVVVYRNPRDEIRLRFYDEELTQQSDFLVRANQGWNGVNAGCTRHTIRRCGLGTSDCCNPSSVDCQGGKAPGNCLRVNGRPSVDIRGLESRGAQCHAVVAYDSMVEGSDGNLWSKSRLDVVRITDESAPSVERSWNSTSDGFTWNQYLSHATVNFFDERPTIGWFWISDNQGPCSLGVEGAVSRDLGATMTATGKFSGSFPAVSIGGFGISDYVRGVNGGDPLGPLYAAWSQPVPTTASCVPCMSRSWNLAAKIARIRP